MSRAWCAVGSGDLRREIRAGQLEDFAGSAAYLPIRSTFLSLPPIVQSGPYFASTHPASSANCRLGPESPDAAKQVGAGRQHA